MIFFNLILKTIFASHGYKPVLVGFGHSRERDKVLHTHTSLAEEKVSWLMASTDIHFRGRRPPFRLTYTLLSCV